MLYWMSYVSYGSLEEKTLRTPFSMSMDCPRHSPLELLVRMFLFAFLRFSNPRQNGIGLVPLTVFAGKLQARRFAGTL